MRSQSDFLKGILVGAGLMYVFDPDRGRRRRALIRDQLVHAGHEVEHLGGAASSRAQDLRNRAQGVVAETRGRLRSEEADDSVVAARVRSELGHSVSNPGAILVDVYEGRVTLRGPILAAEVEKIISSVEKVPGVESVENRLNVHQQPGDVPALQSVRG